jgi:hypothetical protein
MERVDSTTKLGKNLVWASPQKATDLHAQADRRYSNNWSRVEMEMHGIAPSAGGLLKPDAEQ